jgi:hypothetical protein
MTPSLSANIDPCFHRATGALLPQGAMNPSISSLGREFNVPWGLDQIEQPPHMPLTVCVRIDRNQRIPALTLLSDQLDGEASPRGI